MTTKDLAKEVASGYIASLEPFAPHTENVVNYLHELVVYTTRKIALDDNVLDAGLNVNAVLASNDNTQQENEVPLGSDAIQNENDDVTELAGLNRRTIATMEAFLEGCSLAIPNNPLPPLTKSPTTKHTSIREERRKGASNKNKLTTRQPSPLKDLTADNNSSPRQRQRKRYPQFHFDDIFVRLQLYCRHLTRARENEYRCVIHLELARCLSALVDFVLQAFVANTGCVRSMRPSLTKLTQCLTAELLGVEVLGEEVNLLIKRELLVL